MKTETLLEAPGAPRAFLRQTDTADPHSLIREYARYMLEAAGADRLPVDLDKVIRFHGFKQSTGPLDAKMGGRGMLVGRRLVVNSDDPLVVQRLTIGHELTEALVKALAEEGPHRFSATDWKTLMNQKEHLCDYGGAEFILPAHLFFPQVERYRMKLKHGKDWARDCQASLTATVRRMLEANVCPGIFLLAQEAYLRYDQVRNAYGMIWSDATFSVWKPNSEAELRVTDVWRSPQTRQIVTVGEAIPGHTSIYRTYKRGITNDIEGCNDNHAFQLLTGYHLTETLLVKMKDKPTVMALIHPRDLS
jgi:hypothetical protein